MKYEKCLSCEQLGKTCDGPNLLAMETVDLGLWCNELRKDSYEKIAAETELGKTTVSDFLKGKHEDCNMRTARTIAKYVTRGKWDDNPCGNLTTAERAAYEEKIRQFEADIAWRDDKITHLTQQKTDMQTLITNTNKRHDEENARHAEELKLLHKQLDDRYYFLKRKDKVIVILSVLLGLSVATIIAALIIDRLNNDMGFFWLESLLKPSGITEIIQQWMT